jgi:hypothetical protein
MFKKIFEYIFKSVYSTADNKTSATRISSYFILGSILTTTTFYLAIDVINAYQHWRLNTDYIIPGNHLGLFGMILAHHLSLLGINKIAETKNVKSASTATTPVVPPLEENTDGLGKD